MDDIDKAFVQEKLPEGLVYEKDGCPKEKRKMHETPLSVRFNLPERGRFRMKGEIRLTEILPESVFDYYLGRKALKGEQEWCCCFICSGVAKEEHFEHIEENGRSVCHTCLERMNQGTNGISAATVLEVVRRWEPPEEEWQPFEDEEEESDNLSF